MSFATLRVELPAYSHSFQVQVTPSSSIRDVKHEIAAVCPGAPSPDGQRLIWRGRFLSDEEKLEDIWKSPEDSRVIHLAVHPSAWTSTPPSLPSSSPPSLPSSSPPTHPPTRPNFTQSRASAGQPTPPHWQPPASHPHPYPHIAVPFPPVAYIQHLHNTALGILSAGGITLPVPPPINELEAWRSAAKDLYQSQGWVWPDIFEQPFPSGSPGEGASYQAVTVEGLPYLQLMNADATPTPSQTHALRVLSHTFSILSMANDPMLYLRATPHYSPPYASATNVNQHLQHLGFPQLRLAQGANPNPHDPNNHNPLVPPGVPGAEIRAIPVRALMIPLVMLVFRTLLLLYFFSPSKRPLFGLLLSVWILYEAWNAMRLVLNDGNDREAGGAANPGAANGAAGPGQPAAPAGAGAGPNGNGATNGATNRSPASAVVDRLSTLNLAAEDAILDTDAPIPEPGLVQKTKMFCALFFMTLWPSAWDRRRNALRRREGRIRTDAHAREAVMRDREEALTAIAGGDDQDGEQRPRRSEEDLARARQREQMVARHERRPTWLRQYVQRVEYTEWVDDP